MQWDVVEMLMQEFAIGEGLRFNCECMVFVVGDKKQLIYLF